MNLRPLCRASQSAHDSILVSMAQINLRSLVNKTFILNDLFTSRDLDFLFVTKGPYTPGRISARVIRQRFSTRFLCSHPSDFR